MIGSIRQNLSQAVTTRMKNVAGENIGTTVPKALLLSEAKNPAVRKAVQGLKFKNLFELLELTGLKLLKKVL